MYSTEWLISCITTSVVDYDARWKNVLKSNKTKRQPYATAGWLMATRKGDFCFTRSYEQAHKKARARFSYISNEEYNTNIIRSLVECFTGTVYHRLAKYNSRTIEVNQTLLEEVRRSLLSCNWQSRHHCTRSIIYFNQGTECNPSYQVATSHIYPHLCHQFERVCLFGIVHESSVYKNSYLKGLLIDELQSAQGEFSKHRQMTKSKN